MPDIEKEAVEKQEQPKDNPVGRPKKEKGDKLERRVTFLVKETYYPKMKADMEKKGKRSMTDYIIAAINEYMKKRNQ